MSKIKDQLSHLMLNLKSSPSLKDNLWESTNLKWTVALKMMTKVMMTIRKKSLWMKSLIFLLKMK